MTQDAQPIEVYLEIGQTRTFAAALDWPGWCRSGRDEASALQTLYDYGPRYAKVLQATQLEFRAPAEVSALVVVERLAGNATTDFGAPNLALSRDTQPVDPATLERWQVILRACWQAFDAAVEAARGQTLRKGPRGGGRDLTKIVQHVRDVDAAYLRSLGGKLKLNDDDEPDQALAHIRQTILTTLEAAVRGEVAAHGPRGGARWTPRYFVRRLAWHELDHAWEIEDRAE
ncbi:MAG TPA: DinB family protein [Spirillospora sp.]|nr:DinB family protein [Spirillospora sp.]